MDWTNAQVELDPPGCNNVFVANAGEVGSDGVELEVRALLSDQWDVRLTTGYNDAEYNFLSLSVGYLFASHDYDGVNARLTVNF